MRHPDAPLPCSDSGAAATLAAAVPHRQRSIADRNAQIRALDRQGHSHAEIADMVGLTRVRVTQILAMSDAEDLLAEREAQLFHTLDEHLSERERLNRSIAAIRRELDKIAGERAAAQIDRLLGLA